MSWVANLMLSFTLGDEAACEAFNVWLRTEAPQRPQPYGPGGKGVGVIRDTTGEDTLWGGAKYPECSVWAGALNHADLDAVVAKVAELDWLVPAAVQLMLMDQEQNYFRLWMIREGRIRQYSPLPPDDDTAW